MEPVGMPALERAVMPPQRVPAAASKEAPEPKLQKATILWLKRIFIFPVLVSDPFKMHLQSNGVLREAYHRARPTKVSTLCYSLRHYSCN